MRIETLIILTVLVGAYHCTSSLGEEIQTVTPIATNETSTPKDSSANVSSSTNDDDQNHRYERAVPGFRDAVRRNPNNAHAHDSLGLILLASGHLDESLKELREAVRLDEKNAEYRKHLALCLLKSGQVPDALRQCDDIINRASDPAAAHEDVGEFYLQVHRYDDAIRNFTAALNIRSSTSSRLGRAKALFRSGRNAAALEDYDAIIRIDPKHHEAYAYRAYVNMRRGAIDVAEHDAHKALETGKEFAGLAYLVLGATKGGNGQDNLAIENLTKAIAIGRRHPLPYVFRALVRLHSGQPELASADLDAAIETAISVEDLDIGLEGCGWQVYKFRGLIHLVFLRNSTAAIRDFTQALALNDRDADCYTLRAWAQMDQANWENSFKDLNEALSVSHNHLLALNLSAHLLGSCPDDQVRNGQLAIERAEMACALTHWKNSECIQSLAAAKAETGKFDDAVLLQTSVVDLCNNNTSGTDYSVTVWWSSIYHLDITVRTKDANALLELYRQHKPYRLAPGHTLYVMALSKEVSR